MLCSRCLSAVGMSQCAASSGGIESSELAGMWKGTVLLHLEVLLKYLCGRTEESHSKLDIVGVSARVRA